MEKAARNEERRLKAGWYNSLSIAFINIGLLGPAVAQIFGAVNVMFDAPYTLLVPVICLGASAVFHFAGRYEVQELED